MKIEVSNLFDVRKDKKLIRTLFSLTLRGYSHMRLIMHTTNNLFAKDCVVVLAKQDNKIIGWSLIQDNYAHFYVARAFRRRGVGTMLYNKAKKVCEQLHCSAWDNASSQFFNKNKAKLCGEPWQDIISSNQTEIYFD